MPYIGNNHIAGDHTNNFKVLDDISSFTATFNGSASSVVDTTNNTIRVVEHRFIQGQRVTYTNGSGGNIGGLTTGTAYFVIFDSASSIKLATSASNAASSTAINLSAVGTGSSHTLNVAFDGVNTKFKITYNGGTGARFNNATQLNIAINNVLQKPNTDSLSYTEGFAIEDNHKIVFKVAPTSEDIFWGSIIANTLTTFDISDHKIDTFTGDGSTTEFTLSHTPANNESLMVTINGVLQHPSNASTSRAYTLIASIIQFTAAPGVGDEIQVRHMGFAGATTADVSGFYGRTGNVVLTANDHITTGNINAGIVTATSFDGTFSSNIGGSNANFTGIVTAGTFKGGNIDAVNGAFSGNVTIGGTLTYEDVTNIDSVGLITARDGIDCNGDIDVDGHTNLDNVSIAGVATVTGNIIATGAVDATGMTISASVPVLNFNDVDNNPDFRFLVNSNSFILEDTTNSQARLTVGATGNISINNDLDVDGHTNLDNVSIAGIVTATEYRGGGSTGIKVTSAGKVLIGTSTQGSTSADELTIENTGSMGISLRTNSTGESNVYFADGTSGADRYAGYIAYQHQYDRFRFGVNGGQLAVQINEDKSLNLFAGLSVSGIVTATSFSGDGSNLTGITQTTINNNADNRIITGSGTANTLEGEANLTWDGATLAATGSDAQIRLYDSTASSQNSAFRFMAYNGVNHIQSGKAFTSDSKADLIVGSMFGGTEWLRIDSSGRVLIGGGSSPSQVGDGRLIVYADTRLHPAIKADCIDGGSNRANGFTLLADNYLADESICNFGISYSGANLVLSRGCKVSNTTDNAFLSSMDSFAIRPCALVLDDDGALSFHTTENTATTATDSAVSITEVFKIDRVGRIYQKVSGRNMHFGSSGQLEIGVSSGGDPVINAAGGDIQIKDAGNTICLVRSDGFEMYQGIYPSNDSSKDLGKTAKRWANAFVDLYFGSGQHLTHVVTAGGVYNSNLNTATTNAGVYRVNAGITNGHAGMTNYGTLFHANNVSDTGFQMYVNYNNGAAYLRGGNGAAVNGSGSMTGWGQIATSQHNFVPETNNTLDLGSTAKGWRNVYTNDLNLSNMNGEKNDIDGTKGSWTIQEGKDDLYIINRLNGKKFKIKMEEV